MAFPASWKNLCQQMSGRAVGRSQMASALLELPFYHPTFEKGLKSALRDVCKKVCWRFL